MDGDAINKLEFEAPSHCAFCERLKPLSFHHLAPKKTHKNSKVKKLFTEEELMHRGLYLCADCHRKIHATFDHLTLALEYNTRNKLLSDPQISRFVSWVRKQDKRVKRS
jgi:hypothetical protein